MLAAMDSAKISTPEAIRLIIATAAALGHDVSKLALNRVSLHRMRMNFGARRLQEMVDDFNGKQSSK